MARTTSIGSTRAGVLLVTAGGLLVAAALTADLFGFGGRRGIGSRQWTLAACGVLLAMLGPAVSPGMRERIARAWAAMPSAGARQLFSLAASFALLTALVEVAQKVLQWQLAIKNLWQPVGYVWLVALSHLLLFVALGAVLALLGRVRPRAVVLGTPVFVFAFAAAWCQCVGNQWLDQGAGLLLSLGVAVQAFRGTVASPAAAARLGARSLPWLAGAVVVAALAFPLLTRPPASATPPPAGERVADGAPNVLLVVLDTVRADHLTPYGYHRDTTPTLQRLAEGGVVFEHAVATAPWTLPSHATLFTGRYPHETRADWMEPLGGEHPVLAEVLAAHGYATAGFVGNVGWCAWRTGLHRGFGHYEDYRYKPAVLVLSTALGTALMNDRYGLGVFYLRRNDAATVADRFLRWLSDHDGRPFFAFLNFMDAHAPYVAPEPWATRYGPVTENLYQWHNKAWNEQEMQGFRDAYDGCIAHIDHHLGRIVQVLEDGGLLDDTLIIVTSDHGEQFGEHGLKDHANSLYRPLLDIPLVLHFPGKLTPRRIPDVVSLCDVPATALDLAGLPAAKSFAGHSLARFWAENGDAPDLRGSPALSEVSAGIRVPDNLPISKGDMKSLYADGLHYIVNGDGREELYDLQADPAEEHDLVGTERGDKVLTRMREALASLLGK